MDYVVSDGTTEMWNATAGAGYDNDIVGIGCDDDSVFGQVKSKSENADVVVMIEVEGEGTNAVLTFTDIVDLEFMTWGNDDGSTFVVSTEVPSGLLAAAGVRLTREWRVDEIGDVGTVIITFDLSGQGALSRDNAATDYALLIDMDGNFSNATVYTTGASFNGTELSFTGVGFADGDYFSLAGFVMFSSGGVIGSFEFWLKVDG